MGRIEWEDGWAELGDNNEWLSEDSEVTRILNLYYVSEDSPSNGDPRPINLERAATVLNARITQLQFSAMPELVY